MSGERRSSRRKSLDVSADLISDLPRGIIDGIVEHLPLRDVARMSILSHKWRDVWASTPQLVFDAHFFSTIPKKETIFYRTVSKILFQHDGPIFRFSLFVPPLDRTPDLTEWLSYLSRSGVRDFSLQNDYNLYFTMGSHLFSCSLLEKLSLNGVRELSFPHNFGGFKKLVSLELINVVFSEGELEQLITSCPLLEKLSLRKCGSMERVIVDAPNLKNLIVVGIFRSLHIRGVANLVSVSIALNYLGQNWHKSSIRDLADVFANSTTLVKLGLGGHFCKVLFKGSLISTTFKHIRSLELSSICLDDLDGFSSAVTAVQACSYIENLDITAIKSKDLDAQLLDYNLDISLHRLRCAKVGISSASVVELKLIEFLLACSPALEILSLAFIRPINKSLHLKMSKQLIRFRRASPKVEIICPDPTICSEYSDSSSDSDASSDANTSTDSEEFSTSTDSDTSSDSE